jgi:hypothetical protein
MRSVLMVSAIPGSADILVAIGIWVAPCHFGGGGSSPKRC